MLKLFSTTDKSFSSNGDKIIIPTKAKIHKEDTIGFSRHTLHQELCAICAD